MEGPHDISPAHDRLKSAWDAFQRGDEEAVLEVYADDARWEGWNAKDPWGRALPGTSGDRPDAGPVGPDNFDDFRATPDEFREDGNVVIVLGHAQGTTKAGGSFEAPFVHVNRFRDGNLVEVLA